jgi:hypothetical protein
LLGCVFVAVGEGERYLACALRVGLLGQRAKLTCAVE